jgi:hypothetical protein
LFLTPNEIVLSLYDAAKQASPTALAGNETLRAMIQPPVADLEWIHKSIAEEPKWLGGTTEHEWIPVRPGHTHPITDLEISGRNLLLA